MPHSWDRRLTKIRFPLGADAQQVGVEAENLWVEPMTDGTFRIENSPFYLYGISFEDVVAADDVAGQLTFREVVARGSHSTYRIFIKNESGYEDEQFATAWRPLGLIGCTYEIAKRRWVVIDVPPLTDIFAMYALLEVGERAGVWTFEEAHCGHDLKRIATQ